MSSSDGNPDREIRTDASRLQREHGRSAEGAARDGEVGLKMPYEEVVEAAEADGAGAQLVVEQKLALVRARALFVNEEGWRGPLVYKFTARRRGVSGTAEVNRSGTVSLDAGEGTVLTTLPISVESGDRLALQVVVFADTTPISEDRARHHVPP